MTTTKTETLETELENRIRRIAEAWNVPASHVHFDFRIFSKEDGGPCWSVYLVLPSQDRRKAPLTKHFAGYSLAEVEENAIEEVRR